MDLSRNDGINASLASVACYGAPKFIIVPLINRKFIYQNYQQSLNLIIDSVLHCPAGFSDFAFTATAYARF